MPADSPTLLTCKIGRLTSQYECRLPRGEGFPRVVEPRMPWVPKTHGSCCYQATNSRVTMAPTAQTIAESREKASQRGRGQRTRGQRRRTLKVEREFLISGCDYCACCVYFD
jgi:hypothetical protein